MGKLFRLNCICRQNTPLARHICAHSAHRTAQKFHSPRNTRGSSRLPWCVKRSLSSQRHVSLVAALATEHFYTISLTYLTCLPTIFSLTVLSYLSFFGVGSRNPARSPAEWRSGGYTKSASPRGYEPKLNQSDDFELRRLELDRNLGTDPQPLRFELDKFWEISAASKN